MNADAQNPPDLKALFSTCRRLQKDGNKGEAARHLSNALRRGLLDADGILHAGRLLQKIDDTSNALHVSILGQCTTSWLVPALTAVARGRNQTLAVTEADYDNVLQGMSTLDPATNAVVLIPWSQRLLGQSARSPQERLGDELEFWQQVWSMAAARPDLHLVQVGYDWIDAGAAGHFLGSFNGGELDLIRHANQRLRENLPAGSYFVDLEQISGLVGREQMYDRRGYFWTKQPFSDAGVVRLAEHLWAGLRATLTGPKKVLVLDLDNTLWGGVVGETGPLGIELGETPAGDAYRDFQCLAKSLADRGILIAVCSKNNPDDALEPFAKNPDMVLTLDDIAAFKAGWTPKADAIRDIAAELKLGLDSFVFFDDEPAERELVRQALPEVEVIEVPGDPAEYRQALLGGLWFESVSISAEDRVRTKQYQVERQRKQSSPGSVSDYLRSLAMTAEIGLIDLTSIDRVTQLVSKTNQFNLTTRRHTRDAIESMLRQDSAVGLTLRVKDRFGDYGLVGVVIVVSDADSDAAQLRIETWLMSCRIIGRTAEQFLYNALLERLRERDCKRLVGEFIPTKKNLVVADLYERLGFTRCKSGPASNVLFDLSLDNATLAETCIADAGFGT